MNSVLLCPPDYFSVIDSKNPYMNANQSIDFILAQKQWKDLCSIYQTLQQEGHLKEVSVLTPVSGLEDMVFCANQVFPL